MDRGGRARLAARRATIWSPSRAGRCAACCRSPRSARPCSAMPWFRPASAPAAASSPRTNGRPKLWPAPPGRWPNGSAARRWNCAAARFRTAGRPVPATYASFGRAISGDDGAIARRRSRARQRAEVRRASGFGLESTSGTDRRHRDAHYRVYAESVRNLGTPVFPRALFEAMLDAFGDGGRHRPDLEGRPPARERAQLLLQRQLLSLLGRRHARGAAVARQRPGLFRDDAPGAGGAAAPASISAAPRSAPARGAASGSGASTRRRSLMPCAPRTARRCARSIRSIPNTG